MKIKTFTYQISYFAGTADFGPAGCHHEKFDDRAVDTSAAIDREINKFIAKVDVVSVSVNHVITNRHNNGGNDTVQAIYTILYNDKKA